jgi:hypothetical protein
VLVPALYLGARILYGMVLRQQVELVNWTFFSCVLTIAGVAAEALRRELGIGEVEDSLISSLVSEKLLHSLGKQAYRKIERQYSWERVAKLLNEQYNDII